MLFRTVHHRIRSKEILPGFLNSFHQVREIPESIIKLGEKPVADSLVAENSKVTNEPGAPVGQCFTAFSERIASKSCRRSKACRFRRTGKGIDLDLSNH